MRPESLFSGPPLLEGSVPLIDANLRILEVPGSPRCVADGLSKLTVPAAVWDALVCFQKPVSTVEWVGHDLKRVTSIASTFKKEE